MDQISTDINNINLLKHSGIISVVGRTNAGKSTLVNKIIGEKISIVSPVVQTTRNVIRGILTEDRGQMVLVDTPGLHKSKSLLCSSMNKMARKTVDGSDIVMLVIDGSQEPQTEDEGWMRRLASTPPENLFIVLNKSDIGSFASSYKSLWDTVVKDAKNKPADSASSKKEKREGYIKQKDISKSQVESKTISDINTLWFEISSTTGDGVKTLVDALFDTLPAGPQLFDTETVSDYPRRHAIADAIREEFFKILKKELPHSIGIIVDTLNDTDPNVWNAELTLFVKKQNHKGIVIGTNGKNIRLVKKNAQQTISNDYGVTANFNINVKVQADWDQNPYIIKKMGLTV